MHFSGKWRDYQQRVLDEAEAHLADHRLHVVAPPGSGKTILGLELMRRLGRPALILSPTRTIRDQWQSRLVPLFLPAPPRPEELSSNLSAPAAVTASTYQALHALWAGEDAARFARLVSLLKAQGPITLILDEAHHLRREWWKALQALVEALPELRLIALTATPPYDASQEEWSRYVSMCGPMDVEIGVPDLVKNGDLCPHQDHVIFSAPGDDALALLDRRRRGIAGLQIELRDDSSLLDYLEGHSWLDAPSTHAEAILEAPEMLSAILIYLHSSGRQIPRAPLRLLGVSRRDVPPPSAFWLQVLLNGLLFRFPDIFPIGADRAAHLRSVLHGFGLIEGGQVRLMESRSVFNLMAKSIAKLDSIAAIARSEADSLASDLRMVVLSDHIREGELTRAAGAEYKPAKLGVVPVFETLRRAAIAGQPLGVLTGSLMIVPNEAEAPLRGIAERRGVRQEELELKALGASEEYSRLVVAGASAGRAVELVTELFSAGAIRILVGTQALLGEGWDAPAANSLILASNSAAFMLSNQMRGRAIRIDPARPAKVACIWHLATVEQRPENLAQRWREQLDWGALNEEPPVRSDLDLLRRRFRAFEGVANSASNRVESGMERLGISDQEHPAAANARTFQIASNRPAIARIWRDSVVAASPHARVREMAAPNYAPQALAWRDTMKWLLVSAATTGALAAANELRHFDGSTSLGVASMGVAGIATVAALPKLIKAGRLAYRNGSLEGSLLQVGDVVLSALHRAGVATDHELRSAVFEVRTDASGQHEIVLHGVARPTERAAVEAISEILGPIQNPRYLLARTSWLGAHRRTDYHAVPASIGQRKEWAEFFYEQWRAQVGTSALIFTRIPSGRLMLLRARAKSFAAGLQRRVERRSAWL